jgi:Uma2 family endonuclease
MSRAAKKLQTMTLADWGDLDEDVKGELVDGVLEEEEMPTWLHELIVAWFVERLGPWARKHGARVVPSELKIAVAARTGRKPDLSIFSRDDMPALTDSVVRNKPLLVVEVLSPRPRDQRRDRVDKLRDYARAGARHYWLVDPQLRTVEMLRLEGKRYVVETVLASGRVRPKGFAALSLDLGDLWRSIDER